MKYKSQRVEMKQEEAFVLSIWVDAKSNGGPLDLLNGDLTWPVYVEIVLNFNVFLWLKT